MPGRALASIVTSALLQGFPISSTTVVPSWRD